MAEGSTTMTTWTFSWPWRRRPATGAVPPEPATVLGVVFLALACVSGATPPPLHVTLELGVDSHGVPWSVGAGIEGPLVVFGPRTIETSPARRLEHMSLSGAIDGSDRAWIVDATGHGVRVELTTGRVEPVALPVSHQLVDGLVPDAGFVYLADGDARGRVALARIELATNRLARLHEIEGPRTFLTFGVGPKNAWVVSWAGLAGPRQVLQATAVDKASGQVRRQATLVADWAPERSQGLSLDEDAAGNLWIADPYTGQLHRLDAAGAWRSWPFTSRAPVAVVAIGDLAVVQLLTHRALEPGTRPTGAPTHELSEVALAVVGTSGGAPVVRTLERSLWGSTLRGDRTARAWFGRTEVRVTGGRLELVPAR